MSNREDEKKRKPTKIRNVVDWRKTDDNLRKNFPLFSGWVGVWRAWVSRVAERFFSTIVIAAQQEFYDLAGWMQEELWRSLSDPGSKQLLAQNGSRRGRLLFTIARKSWPLVWLENWLVNILFAHFFKKKRDFFPHTAMLKVVFSAGWPGLTKHFYFCVFSARCKKISKFTSPKCWFILLFYELNNFKIVWHLESKYIFIFVLKCMNARLFYSE